MVRPESMTVTPGEGQIEGRVVQTSFLGSHVRVAVETRASEVPVTAALRDADALPAVGDTVHIGWAPGDAIVLEAEP